MVALSASRLVCSAISEIRDTTSPMRFAASARPAIFSFEDWVLVVVWPTISAVVATWREISEMEAFSSSVADATA